MSGVYFALIMKSTWRLLCPPFQPQVTYLTPFPPHSCATRPQKVFILKWLCHRLPTMVCFWRLSLMQSCPSTGICVIWSLGFYIPLSSAHVVSQKILNVDVVIERGLKNFLPCQQAFTTYVSPRLFQKTGRKYHQVTALPITSYKMIRERNHYKQKNFYRNHQHYNRKKTLPKTT